MAIDVGMIRSELRHAIVELNDRGLYQATKWIAEQLVGLPSQQQFSYRKEGLVEIQTPKETSDFASQRLHSINDSFSKPKYLSVTPTPTQEPKYISYGTENLEGKQLTFSDHTSFGGSQAAELGSSAKDKMASQETTNVGETGVDEAEADEDTYFFGKSLFDVREYRRAAYVLRNSKKGKSFFLHCYSTYLAGEKRKEEEILENSDKETSVIKNHESPSLEKSFSTLYNESSLDPFCAYLYGKILLESERKEQAMDMLCFSVKRFPWNWLAWHELQSMCSDHDTFLKIKWKVSDHWMFDFFEASVLVDLRGDEKGVASYEMLHELFPESNYVLCQLAIGKYNLIAFNEAENLFVELCHRDPYRIDGVDIFSNILYVKENLTALSYLAHKVILIDKYRAETCCIIGNYYSLKSQHDKALLYFQRALKLNRKYLSAWTLMGHEFVEIKNISAAIHAYRQAVELNSNDYRAWYGLGQTYELLGMPYYAIYYFRKASQLRPKDARMWQALGNCYEDERLSLFHSSMECYKRAVECDDKDGVAMFRLAKLYESFGDYALAAHYFSMFMDLMDKSKQENSPEIIHSLLFLAMHHKLYNELEKAERFCDRLMQFTGPAKENAKALLREIRSLQKHSKMAKHHTEGEDEDDRGKVDNGDGSNEVDGDGEEDSEDEDGDNEEDEDQESGVAYDDETDDDSD